MNINYTESFNFKPIPAITPASDYWQNSTWKFNMPEITAGTASQPSWQDIILSGNTALTLTNALANGLNYVKLFGGTEQRNLPSEYTQVNYVTNTARTWLNTGVKFDFSKNYEIELRVRGTLGSWYILQARETGSATIYGISGSSTNNTITLCFSGAVINGSQITRINGNIYYIKGTINNGNLTLYIKDETAGTEETVTGTYTPTTGQSVNIGLLGNIAGQAVDINSDVYFARIKEDGNYIMDYVPCKQSTTAGFYDKASNTFKTTTDLSAGDDTQPTPDTPMDIVCNNGVLKFGRIGKNLVNPDAVTQNSYINASGGITSDNNYVISDYIPVQGEQKITISTISTSRYPFGGAACKAFYDSGKNYISNSASPNSAITASTPVTLVVPANAAYFRITIASSAVSSAQVEYGDTATTFEPYKTGIYTDGTQETVNVHGVNIIDTTQTRDTTNSSEFWLSHKNEMTFNNANVWTWSVGENITGASNYWNASARSFAIPCKAGDVFRAKGYNGYPTSTYARRVCSFVDADYKVITRTEWTEETVITAPSNAAYFFIEWAINDDNIGGWVVTRNTALPTDYEPYFNGGTATAEMLLKVGDYKDEQEVLAGGVIRNIGIKVLDGTENWTQSGASTATKLILYASLGNKPAISEFCTFLSTHYPSGDAGNSLGFYTTNTGYVFINLLDTMNSITDFEQFLADQYNAGTPVIVVYPISSPTTETVTGQPLTTQAGTNIVEITQASIDNLGLEVSFKQSTI